MKRNKALIFLASRAGILGCGMLLVALCGCNNGGSTDTVTEAAKAHAQWRSTLNDSVAKYDALQASLLQQTDSLSVDLARLADSFDAVTDPRLVEKYRVARGWKNYDSTSGTGVLARLLEDNSVEIVATASGCSFDAIRFESAGLSAETKPVPADGELNQTIGKTGRVAFNGDDALRLARFVRDNAAGVVMIRYIGAGRVVDKRELTTGQKEMIALTAELHDTQQAVDSLNREYTKAFNKYQLYKQEVEQDRAAKTSGKAADKSAAK